MLTRYRIVISTTIAIYIVTGIKIFKKRALLRSFSRQSMQPKARGQSDVEENPTNPFTALNNIVVTTQIKYDIQEHDAASRCETPEGDQASVSSFSSTHNISPKSKLSRESSTPCATAPAVRMHQGYRRSESSDHPHQHGGSARNGYRATAFATNTTGTEPEMLHLRSSVAHAPARARNNTEGNAAAMAYLKVAFLMFIALFVVWVPSTINRLYQFVNRDNPNYGLNITSAVVLPLQGAWNATIYIFTTRSECRRAYGLLKSKFTGQAPEYQPNRDIYRKDTMTSSREARDSEAEIALDEIFKQGRVRHTELSHPDDVADAEPCRNFTVR